VAPEESIDANGGRRDIGRIGGQRKWQTPEIVAYCRNGRVRVMARGLPTRLGRRKVKQLERK
jgi:hypothetical protein